MSGTDETFGRDELRYRFAPEADERLGSSTIRARISADDPDTAEDVEGHGLGAEQMRRAADDDTAEPSVPGLRRLSNHRG